MKIHKFIAATIIIIFLVSCNDNNSKELSKEEQLKEYTKEFNELKEKIADLKEELHIKEKVKPIIVSTEYIVSGDFTSYLEVPGIITSKQNVNVFAEMPGNITRLYIKEGQYVSKGNLIARQDASTIQAQLGQFESNLTLARTTFERQKRLWEQKIGSEMQYLQTKTAVESLEEQMKALKAQIAKFNIYSPISGTVDEIFINQGEMANGPIARIINLQKVKLEAQLSEKYILNIKRGDKVTVLVPSIDYEKQAKISSIGQVINPDSRTFRVEVSLSNYDKQLKLNMSAGMKVILLQLHDVVKIPANIIQKDGEKDFVYIAIGDSSEQIAVKRYIEISEISEGIAAIENGLSEEDEILIQGHTEVIDSAKIIVHTF